MNKREAVKKGLGQIRINDDSLTPAGINKGDLVLVKLGKEPRQGGLCAAFTAYGHLVIRRQRRRQNGDVCLYTGKKGELKEVFAPGAVVVFGPVVGVERAGAA